MLASGVHKKLGASQRAIQWEIAGLTWLAEPESQGGVRIVRPLSHQRLTGYLLEEKIVSSTPTPKKAKEFGKRLAITHEISTEYWGVGPNNWEGNGYQGPNDNLIELTLQPYTSWGEMYAKSRLQPLINMAVSLINENLLHKLTTLCDRLLAGEFNTSDMPARLHGDLWSGNLIWATNEVVLIDPAAQVGSRETDLANLNLFGCPFWEQIITGYQEIVPLADQWESRIALHQLHLLLLHVVIFGESYLPSVERVVNQY